jgi:hypothetical protein
LQRVAAVVVEVEACAAGDEDALSVAVALQEAAPAPLPVELVEDPELCCRQLAREDARGGE